ncbi:MAG: Holliday junction resolvase RuvX [Candidatus Pacebacteria bacterium]|nr:Holliday junction resolvase RuvX [Candidatus Paceibacterota bacterium]NUQ57189.1 Holliday junction resolvase RuvX [Candidatus Paceibacter sp.]
MRFLGIDYGTKRIGLALSDEKGKMAFAYKIIGNYGAEKVLAELKKICEENSVGKIILGESLNYRGEPNPVMAEIEPFKKAMEKETGLPVEYEKEILTSAEARRPLDGPRKRPPVLSGRKSPQKEKKLRRKIDAAAAALILRRYLDRSVV